MSEKEEKSGMNRRRFLGGIATACVLPCLGMHSIVALASDKSNSSVLDSLLPKAEDNKFDREYNRKLTFQKVFDMQYGEFIQLAKDLENEMGKEKLIEFLKKRTEKQMFDYGKYQAEKASDHTLVSYVSQFKGPNYDNLLTMEIVEESDKVFEIKVTECIWASTFLKEKAGDIGFAAICHGDTTWPQGFNPKLKMLRDKTLMQGNDFCNHRYIIEE